MLVKLKPALIFVEGLTVATVELTMIWVKLAMTVITLMEMVVHRPVFSNIRLKSNLSTLRNWILKTNSDSNLRFLPLTL